MSKGLRPGGKFARVMGILNDGPATTGEVAAELDILSNQASALLRDLKARGYAYDTNHGNGRLRLWQPGQAIGTKGGV